MIIERRNDIVSVVVDSTIVVRISVTQLSVLVDEIITREFASAYFARIILYVQVEKSNLPFVSRIIIIVMTISLDRRVGGGGCSRRCSPGYSVSTPIRSSWQQVSLSVLPVTILGLEGVPAITAIVNSNVAAGIVSSRCHHRIRRTISYSGDDTRCCPTTITTTTIFVVLGGLGCPVVGLIVIGVMPLET